jgi:hypothetical protein
VRVVRSFQTILFKESGTMFRVVGFALLITATGAIEVRADWPACPGGVCPIRTFTTAPAVITTSAPAVRLSTVESSPAVIESVEKAPLFPFIRSIAEPLAALAPVRRVLALRGRVIWRLRNCR